MKNNIYLIGLPMVGKTTIARLLSKELNMKFLDLDLIIEYETKKNIKDIINNKGIKYFRKLETKYLKILNKIKVKNHVISLGGGIVETKKNKKYLNNGIIIYLYKDPNNIIISKDQVEKRPLLKQKTIIDLYKERKDLYNFFKTHTVVTDNKRKEDIVKEIKTIYENINN